MPEKLALVLQTHLKVVGGHGGHRGHGGRCWLDCALLVCSSSKQLAEEMQTAAFVWTDVYSALRAGRLEEQDSVLTRSHALNAGQWFYHSNTLFILLLKLLS